MNRRMPNGTYGGVGGRPREGPPTRFALAEDLREPSRAYARDHRGVERELAREFGRRGDALQMLEVAAAHLGIVLAGAFAYWAHR